MRISHRFQFVFFANPKTGSSSVRQFLNPFSDIRAVKNHLHVSADNPFYPHMPPIEAKTCFEQFGWDFAQYQRFTFVRDPWQRMVSLYEHINRVEKNMPCFEDWLFSIHPGPSNGLTAASEPWRRFGAYSIEHFIKDENGSLLVDKVIRLEDIDEELPRYLKAIGVPLDQGMKVLRKNVSHNQQALKSYYNTERKDWVAKLFAYDIALFNYQFNE